MEIDIITIILFPLFTILYPGNNAASGDSDGTLYNI